MERDWSQRRLVSFSVSRTGQRRLVGSVGPWSGGGDEVSSGFEEGGPVEWSSCSDSKQERDVGVGSRRIRGRQEGVEARRGAKGASKARRRGGVRCGVLETRGPSEGLKGRRAGCRRRGRRGNKVYSPLFRTEKPN